MTRCLTTRPGLFLAAGLAAASLFPLASAQAQDAKNPSVISVSAEGSASVRPDMAVVSMTVLREAQSARAALDENSAAMKAVLDAMKAEGIAERDMQTSNFSIQPQWVYPDRNRDGADAVPRIVGYQVSNQLTLRIRDLGRLGAILDASVSLGVNQGGNIVFTNDDPSGAIAEARRKAVENAIDKASTLVQAAGVGLGRITSISEQSYQTPPAPMMRAEFAKAAADGAAVPVAAGENEYSVNVSMSWEISQ